MLARRRSGNGRHSRALWSLGAALASSLAMIPIASAAALRASHSPSELTVADAGALDGPALFQAICSWVALLAMTFWVGGVIVETWILAPGDTADQEVSATAESITQRFRQLAPYALALLFVADFGAIRFGSFWWLRQIVVLGALALSYVAWRNGLAPLGESAATEDELTMGTAANQGGLLQRLADGWRRLDAVGRGEVALAAALIVAFTLSRDVTAIPASKSAFAFVVDLLFLLAEATWLGGLLFIALVVLPVGMEIAPRGQARLLASSVTSFGAVAFASAALLVVTGALDATIRLSSFQQILTTTYGRTLFVEVEIFVILVAISIYLVLNLRPRLASELGDDTALAEGAKPTGRVKLGASRSADERNATQIVSRGGRSASATPSEGPDDAAEAQEPPLTPKATSLEERIRDWLRRQALLGGAALLCVALLGVFAGSLMPAAPAPSGSTGATATPFSGKQAIAGLFTVQLDVSPNSTGANTFTVTLTDTAGKPVTGATVALAVSSTDMDMGTATPTLAPVDGKAGAYSGQAPIAMAGGWQVIVNVTPAKSATLVKTTFTFTTGF